MQMTGPVEAAGTFFPFHSGSSHTRRTSFSSHADAAHCLDSLLILTCSWSFRSLLSGESTPSSERPLFVGKSSVQYKSPPIADRAFTILGRLWRQPGSLKMAGFGDSGDFRESRFAWETPLLRQISAFESMHLNPARLPVPPRRLVLSLRACVIDIF